MKSTSTAFPLLASNAFDIFLFETFMPLLSGGKAVILNEEQVKDIFILTESLKNVTAFHAVPALMSQVTGHIKAAGSQQEFSHITDLFVGGDSVPTAVLQEMREVFPAARINTLYGPTESTIFTTIQQYRAGDGQQMKGTLIGKPNLNTKIYILDKKNQLLPVGITGEICVGGSGVARGYLGQEELSKEKFITDPFCDNGFVYKTGDMGRWLPDGTVEFMGRRDEQVKIRGFRIELGEIENTLLLHPLVTKSLVLVKDNAAGEKVLIAYVEVKGSLPADELKIHAESKLPAYMLPSHIIQLDTFPLTPNGKIDRKKLSQQANVLQAATVAYLAPRNETEKKLAIIWSEVLGSEKTGVHDNFFESGGHSLALTKLASRIYKAFEIKLPLKQLFINTTIEQQAALLSVSVHQDYLEIPSIPSAVSYALSSSQKRLWVLSQFEEGSTAYNMPGAYVFEGALDEEALSRALKHLVERHEILRTVFKENEEGEVRQYIIPAASFNFAMERSDLREYVDKEQLAEQYIQSGIEYSFNLEKGPLLRALLLRMESGRWIFGFTIHHIISDGWSMGVIIREVLSLYHSYSNGAEISLPEFRIQYKDYAAWQQSQLSGSSLEQHTSYWLKQFEGEIPVLELPADLTRPTVKTYNGGRIGKQFNSAKVQALKHLCMEQDATLFMGLQALVNTLLYRYSGQENIITGSPVAGRDHIELEDQIGCYLNTLALRTRFNGKQDYKALLAEVRKITLDAYGHQVYPFDELVELLSPVRNTGRSPLFDVMVVLQSADPSAAKKVQHFDALEMSAYGFGEHVVSKFDLTFDFAESEDNVSLSLEYNSDIYLPESIRRMISHFENLMDAVIAAPSAALCELEYLGEEEKILLLQTFNISAPALTENKTIAEQIEEQAALTPDRIAVKFENTRLSYKLLNEESNRLASYLREQYAVQPDDLIAVKLERSGQMIIALLAILKSGAAYVPIDVNYPQERIDYILDNSKCKLLVDAEELKRYNLVKEKYNALNLLKINTPAHLAYVIYTSGSTGKPKGVMVEHRSLSSFLQNYNKVFGIRQGAVFAALTNYTFDISILELIGTLVKGGTILLIGPSDPLSVLGIIRDKEVNVLQITPSRLKQFYEADAATGMEILNRLDVLLVGGEALSPQLHTKLQQLKTKKIFNVYGPTETTIWSTCADIRESEILSVGKPLVAEQVYITDDNGALVPIGITGEICIAGPGLARGYLHNPELTAARFTNASFADGIRLYKTGDHGKLLPDGTLVFLGRKDDQVKLNGFRIELGEVESALRNCPGINDAVVMVKTNEAEEEQAMVAYIVSNHEPDVVELRAYLAGRLPAYMIPAYYIKLEKLPLNSSGKTDKKALPGPEGNLLKASADFIAAETEMEKKVAAVFAEVLGKKEISIHASFFDLGGDSFKLVRLFKKLSQLAPGQLVLVDLFDHTTVEKISRHLENKKEKEQVIESLAI